MAESPASEVEPSRFIYSSLVIGPEVRGSLRAPVCSEREEGPLVSSLLPQGAVRNRS